mmetsp:Transcript_8851/g.17513  ORF Transcript_8851/g.17513 Transcript_8851/m.17513 type:complete len:89 (-) Transcript_8851:21-287(-)
MLGRAASGGRAFARSRLGGVARVQFAEAQFGRKAAPGRPNPGLRFAKRPTAAPLALRNPVSSLGSLGADLLDMLDALARPSGEDDDGT